MKILYTANFGGCWYFFFSHFASLGNNSLMLDNYIWPRLGWSYTLVWFECCYWFVSLHLRNICGVPIILITFGLPLF